MSSPIGHPVLRTSGSLLFIFGALSSFPVEAESFRPVVAPADIDFAACKSYHHQTAQDVSAEVVQGILGLKVLNPQPWSAGKVTNPGSSELFHYRLAFRRELALGAVLVPGRQEVRLLKADAPFPGDPLNAAHWSAVVVPPRQSGADLLTLPPNTRTRAVLLTEKRSGPGAVSTLRALRLLPARLHNVTPEAMAYADREYRPPQTDYLPYPATAITAGRGPWINTGKNDKGFIPSPIVSELHPSWFLLSWQREQSLVGLWLQSNIEKLEVEYYAGPPQLNPRAGTSAEWRKVRTLNEQADPVIRDTRWISFDTPIRTRGLRLNLLKTSEGPIATISGLHALVNLGEQPVPPPSLAADEPPPVRIPYRLAEDGNLTLVVNGPDGRRARNLITRAAQAKGEHTVGWDLKDEEGNFVTPGVYRWSALTYPSLQLRYEMTVYPNVSRHAPENSPWLNGHHGSGGWLADHTPPVGGCVAGDRVYLSAYVAESGVSLIECDLQGRKLWGHHSFAAWTGPRFLASDGKEVFVGAPILGTSTEAVWAVDIASKKVREVLSLKPTAQRLRGLQGMAAREGKLYLSVRGTESWLAGAASADDADVPACLPVLPERRKPRFPYEITPDPRGDFLRLFRLTGTPPGGATQFTQPWLESMSSPSPRQHIILAFKRPVPLGSVVYPVPQDKGIRVSVSVLKPDAPYPPLADHAAHWLPLPLSGKALWDVVPAPEKTMTRALRITFARGSAASDDPLDKALDSPKSNDDDLRDLDKKARPKDVLEFGADKGAWKGRLEGMKLLRRRFVNVAAEATVRVNSGKIAPDGIWDAQRKAPLSESDPGIYLLEWKAEQPLRGLAIKEVDGDLTKIDVYTGPADKPIDLAGANGWETVAEYRQARRNHHSGFEACNSTARYLDGYVDFGREVRTRAVRLRVVRQWVDNAPDSAGVRADQGGTKLDPTRCRVYGVAALKYLGGEHPTDAAALERIEVYDSTTGKPLDEIPLARPGEIAFNPAGNLHTVSGTQVVRIDPRKSEHRPLVSDLLQPTDLAFDRQGQLYVYDGGKDRSNVRVYDPNGKYLRSIGTPGGFRAGPWDPTRMGTVTAIAVDHTDQLWVVENQYHPKRVTVWSTDGTFKKELLGNTPYGGGGVLDPWDKRRLFYGPLEFELDWNTGLSRIKNLTWTGNTPPGEVPIRIDGRTYLVTRPQFADQACAVVYRYEKDQLRLAAAMGAAAAFEPLRQPEMRPLLGSRTLTELQFLWSDRNGDGQVQADEVTLSPPSPGAGSLTNFNRDLSIQAGPWRYQVKEFLPGGVPVYEQKLFPGLAGRDLYRLNDGSFFRLGEAKRREAVLSPDGKPLWTYPQEGEPGVGALHHAKPWRPDQVVAQFGIVGHETVAGDLGEFIALHGNSGAWNVWTRDGLLLGPIFRDFRSPGARPWSMKEHQRGLLLEDLTTGEEHFSGYLCRTVEDNKVYVVAGHNHISILEVLGLDRCKRLGGELIVTAEDIRKAQEWDARRQRAEVFVRAPVIDCYRVRQAPALDGKQTGWGEANARIDEGAEFRIGYDDQYLYLAYQTRNLGPLKNTGRDWERLFKTGAAVDLHLALDPNAPADRQAPASGDVRLLLTYLENQPAAVLYRPVVPGTPPEKAWRVKSPVGETVIDEVVRLKDVRLVRGGDANQYVLEAAVPLAALGLRPVPDLRLKMDWGILVSGPDGQEVLRRVYWANRATQIVSDAPSEARLAPHLWGHVRFHGHRPGADDQLNAIDLKTGPDKPKDVKKDVKDILDDLKPPSK